MEYKSILLSLLGTFIATLGNSQIFDVHLHSYTDNDYWGGQTHPTGILSPSSAQEHLVQTIEMMDKHNVRYAIVSGSVESISKYVEADSRFIPGYMDEEELIPIKEFETHVKEGTIRIFGEVSGVYFGRTLNDPVYAPYLKICEEYGIPVAYHTGGGPPMTPYRCCPKFRISHGDPLLIEDVLIRYPKLQVYLMHSGEVFFENAVRMLNLYQHLYVDLGVLLWVSPLTQDYAVRFLKSAKNSGVLDRVMYGTDQMVWPGAATKSIEFLNSLEFLTPEDKQTIVYDNAIRFFKINE